MRKRSIFHWDLFASIFLIITGPIATYYVWENKPTGRIITRYSRYGSRSGRSRIDANYLVWFILLGIAIMMIVGGLNLFRAYIRRARKRGRMVKSGIKLTAVVSNVKMDVMSGKNRSHFYYLECTWQDELGREKRVFRSENTFTDFGFIVGAPITVYFNPKKPADYYVDLESVEV